MERKKVEYRRTIMGNEHERATEGGGGNSRTAGSCTHVDVIQYLSLWQSDVQDVGLASWFAVLQPGIDHLVTSDLAVLLDLQRRLPGDPDSCRVDGIHFQLPGRRSWHWKVGSNR